MNLKADLLFHIFL